MVLTDGERELAVRAFYQGPDALLSEGYTPEQTAAFIEREDVQVVILLLKRELDIHEGLKARAKFKFTRNLHRLIDGASAVIANGLAGPVYSRDAQGHVLRDAKGHPILRHAEPTRTQLRAAKLVMDGVGISDYRIRSDAATDPSTKLLFHTTEEEAFAVETDPMFETEEDRALSRERVRNAIEALVPRLTAARGKAKATLGIDPAEESTTAKLRRVKRSKKKATKKKRTVSRRGKTAR